MSRDEPVRDFGGGAQAQAHSSLRRIHRVVASTFVGIIALVLPAVADGRDLVVYGEPTLANALRSLGTLWNGRSGTRVNVLVAPTDLSYAQIERGARCDVIFAPAGVAADEAAHRDIVRGATLVPVFRNPVILVGNEPAVPRAMTSADVPALVTGKTIAIANPDRDPGGARALDFLRKLGRTTHQGDKTVLIAESSAGVMNLLATRKVEFGIVYATDAIDRVALTVALSDQEPPISYVMAEARNPASDTAPFRTFVQSREARATLRSAGLLPLEGSGGAP
jgi:molybdenum ABC transporter molybdate-binding protein